MKIIKLSNWQNICDLIFYIIILLLLLLLLLLLYYLHNFFHLLLSEGAHLVLGSEKENSF